jgi:glycosyltransferase involved in cell wall biosynthesis
MNIMKKLSIVIPIYNEAETLPQLLGEWTAFCKKNGFDLILVNDGSKDGSKEILEKLPAAAFIKVLHHKVNRGYGGAIKTGIRSAETSYVVTIDADGQHELASILDLLAKLEASDADMVIGSRGKSNRAFTFRNTGKALIRGVSRMLIPNKISDLNSGMKLYRTDLAKQYIDACPDTMAYSDVIALTFISEGALVVEQPITIKPRLGGKSTINLRSAFDTIQEIINIVMFFNPLRIFFPISVVSFLAGLAWGLPILIQLRGLSVGALFAFIVSIISLLLGLVAEQLSQIRKMLIRSAK